MRSILFSAILLFSISANASTVDIDIASAPCDIFCTGPYSIDGFDIGTDVVFRNLGFWGFDDEQTLTLETSSGNSFDLNSIGASINLNGPWIVTGYYVGGGTVQTSIDVSGNFTFDSSWQGLEKVDVLVQPGSLSGITASTVPVPAAVWLFGSALVGLGWLRRAQTA